MVRRGAVASNSELSEIKRNSAFSVLQRKYVDTKRWLWHKPFVSACGDAFSSRSFDVLDLLSVSALVIQ
jgi:hypothetical protein